MVSDRYQFNCTINVNQARHTFTLIYTAVLQTKIDFPCEKLPCKNFFKFGSKFLNNLKFVSSLQPGIISVMFSLATLVLISECKVQ